MPFSKILIAVDSTAYSMKAAKCGFELAHELKAMVAIVCVVDKAKEVVNADLGITAAESKSVLLEEAEMILEQYTEMYKGIGRIFRFTPEGAPEKEILNVAIAWQTDLIVMGTHGRSGLGRMLTGSVAEAVIRHSVIPVLVAPPGMTL